MNAIYKFVMAMLAKSGGKTGLTTIQRGKGLNVELSVKQIEQTLKNMGVDVSKITSPKEVEKFLNIQKSWLNQQTKGSTIGEHRVIDATSPEGKEITESLFGKKGEVVDLSGKKIDTSKPIMGGKNVPETKKLDPALYEDRGKDVIPVQFSDNIVVDTIATIKSKKPIDAMKEASSVIGRKGKYKNLTEEQSQKILKDTNDHIFERDIKYDEFGEIIKPNPEDLAGGGIAGMLGEPTYEDDNHRVPFAMGKRAFLKWLGSGVAGIGAAKTGLFGLLKGGGKKQFAEEVVKQSAGSGTPPAYFFNLVKKIKNLGDDVTETASTAERQKVHKYKDYEMTEDISTGKIEIKKDGSNTEYHKYTDGEFGPTNMSEEVYMSHTPGETIIGKGGKPIKVADDYIEDTSYVRSDRGNKGEIHETVDGVPKEVVQEGTVFEDTIAEFTKKASGGRVPLSGGKLVVKGGNWLIKSLLDTRKQIKTMNLSPGQLKQYLNQIDDQIKNIKDGGKIPDEVIQTIRSDPKFKSVTEASSKDPDLMEMEEVLLEYGTKHASGGLAGMLGE